MLIWLYGPPGVGKSTIGRRLAQVLGWPFIDVDEVVAARAGMPISQIFRLRGEQAFRALEATTIRDLGERWAEAPGAVLALGGGALLDPDTRAWVTARGRVLFLEASTATLLDRVRRQRGLRPLLADADEETALRDLLAQRAAHYASFPLRVRVDGLTPEEAVWQVQMRLGCFRLKMGERTSEILVQSGSLERLGMALASRWPHRPPVILVSDAQVGPLHADRVRDTLVAAGFGVQTVLVPAGEQAKDLAHLASLWTAFLEQGLDRRSLVLALGGGVVGDLTGFAAATFMRGVDWVNLPTSLLAMVDAAIGGKTGINLPQGKNLAGAFHPPRLVWIDPLFLETLPTVERRSGLAEVFKHALLADPGLFTLLERVETLNALPWPEVVRRAVAVKVRIVKQDPYERRGVRALLNLGHTIGHGLEAASCYSLRHGEAVAIGLVWEAHLAERLGLASAGLAERIAAGLRRLGLPTSPPMTLKVDAVLAAMLHDKKRRLHTVRFALPQEVGKAVYPVEPSWDLVEAVVREAVAVR